MTSWSRDISPNLYDGTLLDIPWIRYDSDLNEVWRILFPPRKLLVPEILGFERALVVPPQDEIFKKHTCEIFDYSIGQEI